jgi:16S rRNA (guanine527-N7)-methyltransferase
MDAHRLNELLAPFVPTPLPAPVSERLLQYLGLLLKWNARINLTAVRDAEQMVTRHFGESLFAAVELLRERFTTAVDVGSGAGFPGLPLAIYSPETQVTLIESQNKKAGFLREVVRTLRLSNVMVENARAEALELRAEVVTMRAVEKFDQSAPAAAGLVSPSGRLAMLIGASQVDAAQKLLPQFKFAKPIGLPQSSERVLLVGRG